MISHPASPDVPLTAVLFQCILKWIFGKMCGLLFTSLSASFTAGITPCPIRDWWWPFDVGKNPARWTSWRWWRCRRGCSSSPKLPPGLSALALLVNIAKSETSSRGLKAWLGPGKALILTEVRASASWQRATGGRPSGGPLAPVWLLLPS